MHQQHSGNLNIKLIFLTEFLFEDDISLNYVGFARILVLACIVLVDTRATQIAIKKTKKKTQKKKTQKKDTQKKTQKKDTKKRHKKKTEKKGNAVDYVADKNTLLHKKTWCTA